VAGEGRRFTSNRLPFAAWYEKECSDLSLQVVADIMQFLDRPMRDQLRRDRQEPIVALD
jgi:hypothetical protein